MLYRNKEHGEENYFILYIAHNINYIDCKINDSYFNKSATLTAVLSILIAYLNNNCHGAIFKMLSKCCNKEAECGYFVIVGRSSLSFE